MTLYDDASNAGKEAFDSALKSFSIWTKGVQQIAAQSTDFTKQSYEQSAQLFEKLSQARSLDRAAEVQAEFARDAYERWVSQATKVGEIVSDVAKETYKPFEDAVTTAANRGAEAVNRAA